MSFTNAVSSINGTGNVFGLKKAEKKQDLNQSATEVGGLKFKENLNMGLTIEKTTAKAPAYDTPKQLGAVREKRIEDSMATFEAMFETKREALKQLMSKEFNKQISEEALDALTLTQMNID